MLVSLTNVGDHLAPASMRGPGCYAVYYGSRYRNGDRFRFTIVSSSLIASITTTNRLAGPWQISQSVVHWLKNMDTFLYLYFREFRLFSVVYCL